MIGSFEDPPTQRPAVRQINIQNGKFIDTETLNMTALSQLSVILFHAEVSYESNENNLARTSL